MQRMSDAALLRWLRLLPVLAAVVLVLIGAVIIGLLAYPFDRVLAFHPIAYLAAPPASSLGVVIWGIRREAAKRAGGSAGVEAWRSSYAWAAPEFRLDHDYDPTGSDFQALLRIAGEHGYILETAGQQVRQGSSWQFRRASA